MCHADPRSSSFPASTAEALQALLHHPSTCLPDHDLKHLGMGFSAVLDSDGSPIYLPRDHDCERTKFVRTLVHSGVHSTPAPASAQVEVQGQAEFEGAKEGVDFETLMLLGATGFGEGQRFAEMDGLADGEGLWTGL